MSSVLIALLLVSSFPNVEIPRSISSQGTVSGDSILELSIPQQLIPGYCKSFRLFNAGADLGLLVAIPDEDGRMAVLFQSDPDSGWHDLSAIGPCDSTTHIYSFPAMLESATDEIGIAMIAADSTGDSPFVFFQPLDPNDMDSCTAAGIAITDPALPDTLIAIHHPSLVTASDNGHDKIAMAVWDTYSWDTYLFRSEDEGLTFFPEPDVWTSSLPRPDSCGGGPTLLAASASGDLLACFLAEVSDSTHMGLQPYVSWGHDWGSTWDEPVLLPAAASGSALEEEIGPMPYGSFRGGCPWYGADILFSGETPLVIWEARRAPGDTLTPEERLWPQARAVLCSHYLDGDWETVFMSRALEDSFETYDSVDWPTATVGEDGSTVVFWSDMAPDSGNMEVWASGRNPVTGFLTNPVALTSTPGNEAMLEALPQSENGAARLLLSDARLLFGEKAPLMLAQFDLGPVWSSGTRTDVAPSLSSHLPIPETRIIDLRAVPNPAVGSFRLIARPGLDIKRVSIYDLLGRLRMSATDTETISQPWSVRSLPTGAYFIIWRGEATKGTVPLLVLNQ